MNVDINPLAPDYPERSQAILAQTDDFKYHVLHTGPIVGDAPTFFNNLAALAERTDAQGQRIKNIVSLYEYREITHDSIGCKVMAVAELLWDAEDQHTLTDVDHIIDPDMLTDLNLRPQGMMS